MESRTGQPHGSNVSTTSSTSLAIRSESHSISSNQRQCPCFPLHRKCDASKCLKAASQLELKCQSKRQLKWAVDCSMSDLRVAALEGCSICGTYYAGLHMLDSEACRYGDNDLSVKIKNDGSYVAVQKSNSLFIQNEYDFWNVPSALEDPSSSCRIFSAQDDLSSDTSSEASYHLVEHWIKECVRHETCKCPTLGVLPTRVLDIGPFDQPDFSLYLLETDGLKAECTTLSHCWGITNIATTTTESLPRRKQGIDVTLLPNTFADAVDITRRLRIRYLWIDSLCIIQDDENDWQLESRRMADIYQIHS